jgi:hypothetical protein
MKASQLNTNHYRLLIGKYVNNRRYLDTYFNHIMAMDVEDHTGIEMNPLGLSFGFGDNLYIDIEGCCA